MYIMSHLHHSHHICRYPEVVLLLFLFVMVLLQMIGIGCFESSAALSRLILALSCLCRIPVCLSFFVIAFSLSFNFL